MKKLLALVLVAVMMLAFVACGETDKADGINSIEDVKFGLICLHDENSTYDKNFIEAFKEAVANLGLKDDQWVIKTNIPEGNECYEAAVDLAADGCNIIFANSFGHESYLLQAAKEYPAVQFCHATGTMAHTEKLDNFANAFASIYEGRFLAGVAAGMKLNEMIEAGKITAEQALMGYVGAFPYAEVISGYTSFYLGAKSVCPSVTMKVQFTGSWYDEAAEKEAATKLLNEGCVLISQHADSMGAPTACEEAGVPNVSYNGSTVAACPNTFIVSSRINWAPYYEYVVNTLVKGEKVATDWTGTIETESVLLTDVNTQAAAAGTVEKIEEVKAALIAGNVNVFDASTFTVGGVALDSYLADVDTDAAYEKDTEVIDGGVFYESKFRSAPYFDVRIDGITLLNDAY
ncbi:MAG: BMP family ABC transporter substrate-binding protein [Ruminococcaceae bacterium]|nr:BMP family ABC transporter substrate-binding protein [Oscillospiraceae bacterium]